MINEIYCLVGEILEVAQYIEWNVALIICKSQNKNADSLFSDMQNMTLGEIKNCAKKSQLFYYEDIEELELILEKRNYLVHQFFKKNDIVKQNSNKIFLRDKLGELKNILVRFQSFNNVLSKY